MLRREEELVKETSVKRDQRLPLYVGEPFGRMSLLLTDRNAFLLDHNQTGVDALDFIRKLFLGYWPRLGLNRQLCICMVEDNLVRRGPRTRILGRRT